MSRYPWMEYVDEYMTVMKVVFSKDTYQIRYRRYRRQAQDVRRMYDDKRLSSSSPSKMTWQDVRTFLTWRRSLGYTDAEYAHELTAFKGLFNFCGNKAVDMCLTREPSLKSRISTKRKNPMSDKDYSSLVKYFSEMNLTDEKAVRDACVVLCSLECGCRTVEIRSLTVGSVDLDNKILSIDVVKGGDTYGQPRQVVIPEYAIPVFTAYMVMRGKPESEQDASDEHPLFTPVRRGVPEAASGGLYTGNSLRRMKDNVALAAGVERFNFQDCRRTYGQNYLDDGADIEMTSVLMGHHSTRTTEKYYARMRNDRAVRLASGMVRKKIAGAVGTPSVDDLGEDIKCRKPKADEDCPEDDGNFLIRIGRQEFEGMSPRHYTPYGIDSAIFTDGAGRDPAAAALAGNPFDLCDQRGGGEATA